MEVIKQLTYSTLHADYYQVVAITDEDKICLEGNVCKGILKMLINRANASKGNITKTRKKNILVWLENKKR